jgi:ribonuclease HI
MRTALLAATVALALTALPSPALAGEEAKAPASAVATMDAKVKAERIKKVDQQIFKLEHLLSKIDGYIAQAKKDGQNEQQIQALVNDKAKATASLPKLKIELRWLKGEATLAGTEAAVKVAEEALTKAEKDKAPLEAPKAALEKATFERDEIERLEAAEKPKQKEPEA